jgi:hypothetical protein
MASSYDGQFSTLARSLRDNYLQYKLTGSKSAESAFTSAATGIEAILADLQTSVDAQKAQISDFYKTDTEGALKALRTESHSLQHGIVEQKDRLTAAQMRQSQTPSVPTEDLTSRYIAAGVLLGATILVAMV